MAASAGNAVGTIGGFKKMSEGKKMQKEAQKKIDAFEFDELKNVYDDRSVATMGADLRMEEAGKTTASLVGAAREGGTRGIASSAGMIANQQNAVAQDVAAGLEQQEVDLSMAAAADDAAIRTMTEKRQTDELAGYGQMMNVGMGMKYQGYGDVQASAQAQGQENQDMIGMATSMFGSDRRLKKNIELVGKSPSGLSIYNFEYTFKDGVWQGVMSDEIPQEAVVKNSFNTGYDAVDYSKIDVEFKQIA